MLFSRVYNWIKYKTLPPSVLFLNRVFVERDSKHRRILSNLGLTFRNSKWSTYARTNVQYSGHAHLHTFLQVSISLTIVILILYYTTSYYSFVTSFNYLFVPIWFLADFELYTSSFYTFISWITLNQVTAATPTLVWLSNSTFKMNTTAHNLTERSKYTCIPKRFYKPIIHKWATTTTNCNINFFEGIMSFNLSLSQSLYKNLYNLVRVFQHDSHSILKYQNILHWCDHDLNIMFCEKLILSRLMVQTCATPYNILLLDYEVKNLTQTTKVTTHEFSEWTLSQLWNEHLDTSLSSSVQPFYLSQINYNAINKWLVLYIEFIPLLSSLEAQSILRSTHKWMYKYNMLHRASLRDPFQLTSFLRQLAPSFYTSTFFSRNMWTSSTLNSNLSSHLNLGNYQEALYSHHSLYTQDNVLSHQSTFRNLHNFLQLNSFATSYNWTLQRFYLFNTLSTHLMRWTTNLRVNETRNLHHWVNIASSWNSNFQWHLNNKHWIYASPLSINSHVVDSASLPINLQTSNNLYLNYSEYTLFSKLNVELALNLITTQGSPALMFYSLQSLDQI